MKYFIIPTGADEEIFSLCENQSKRNIDQFKLIYYGTFIPNHGVPYIIEASKFLTLEKSIKFQFIGEGPELEKCKNLVDKYNLSNVEFIPWQNPNQIKKFIGDADIVLGAFGKTPQSLMTVQNKIYESLAMGKLVVSGDSPTVRNHFINGQEIVLCDRDNPSDFANKIIELRDNKEKRFQIAENGHKKFTSMYSILKIGGILDENLRDLIK
jgi:glycosyltransferase involved in cell wall biosynthesis